MHHNHNQCADGVMPAPPVLVELLKCINLDEQTKKKIMGIKGDFYKGDL